MKTIERPVSDMQVGAPYAYTLQVGKRRHVKPGVVTSIEWAGRHDRSRIIVEVKDKVTGKPASRAVHNMVGTYDVPVETIPDLRQGT